jgi:triosephosphate isomerase
MNLARASGAELAASIAAAARQHAGAEVCVFPPFPYLEVIHSALGGAAAVGGQDCSDQRSGAFTGQVAASMLKDVGCGAVLIGHSERRHGLGEHDALLSEKLRRAVESGLVPVLCVGETLGERESGRAHDTIETQLRGCLTAHSEDSMARLVVAYEPVWAIGTGRTATPDDAADAHRTVRRTLADLYSASFSESVRVIYGGSVNAKNADDLFQREEIDGGLVGGASLKGDEFTAIIAAASARAAR